MTDKLPEDFCEMQFTHLPHKLWLSIFDCVLELRTDEQACFDIILFLLSRFVIQKPKVFTSDHTQLTLITKTDDDYTPFIFFEGKTYPFPISKISEDQKPEEWFYLIILHLIVSRIRTHFLIHAAAVSYRDEGIVFAGGPGYGKSTLAMALLRRGSRFLSDEFAAIKHSDGYLYPFPRKLLVKADSFQYSGFASKLYKAKACFDKLALDVDDMGIDLLGERAPLRYVFILQDPQNRTVVPGTHPSLNGEPCCLPLPRHKAAMWMINHYYDCGLKGFIQDEYDNKPLKLYVDMVNVLKNARCFALHVGQLEQELDLVMKVIHGS